MALNIQSVVGRFIKNGNGSQIPPRLTGLGSAAVAQTEPYGAEALRAGARFYGGCTAAASGIAPDTSYPTTTAKLVLWNGESAGGRSYYVDEVAVTLGSGTAAAGISIWVILTSAAIAAPTAAASYASQSASMGSKTTKARWATAITVAGTWRPIGGAGADWAAAANFGQGLKMLHIPRGILVPPQYALGFAVLSGAGTSPLYTIGAAWDELELDLE